MAAKMAPEQLREQAKKLMEQAAAEEARRHQLIGKIVVEFIENNFQGFDLDLFKTQAGEIWTDGKLKRKPKAKSDKSIEKSAAKQQGQAA